MVFMIPRNLKSSRGCHTGVSETVFEGQVPRLPVSVELFKEAWTVNNIFGDHDYFPIPLKRFTMTAHQGDFGLRSMGRYLQDISKKPVPSRDQSSVAIFMPTCEVKASLNGLCMVKWAFSAHSSRYSLHETL